MVFYFDHQIEAAVPTLARPMMSLDATEDAIVGNLKQSLVFPISFGSCIYFHESVF